MEDADLTWRTASYSSNGGGNCVEVAGGTRRVLIRDTQDRTGPVLRFAPAAWRSFADQVKRSLAREALQGSRTFCRSSGCSRVPWHSAGVSRWPERRAAGCRGGSES